MLRIIAKLHSDTLRKSVQTLKVGEIRIEVGG